MNNGLTTGGPSHHLGEGAPLHQINTRARDLGSQNQDDKPVPEGWKQPSPEVNIGSQNSVSSRAGLDGVNLDSSIWSSTVPGNRGLGRQDENPGMLRLKMTPLDHCLMKVEMITI